MTVIADYGVGNLRSVKNALARLGAEYIVSSEATVLRTADRVILPGVGDASEAMSNLVASGLHEVIPTLTVPVLGICVGMQLMCLRSEEGNAECMGIFPAEVKRLSSPTLKVPHMGWDSITDLRTPLLKGVADGERVYYVHSFAPELCDDTISVTDYTTTFSGALGHDNFYGTQFHPEKSGNTGALILKNFLSL